ncbi:MAG TPA: hypothetical protein PL011_05675, partial [Kiritimatiellia bacterium]|nr:hypothetical protein [Kiritimatiellia bacterium]
MAQFRYIAKSRAGERREGVLDAPDRRSVMLLLSRQGLVPISVTDGGGGAAPAAATDKPAVRSGDGKPARSAPAVPAA